MQRIIVSTVILTVLGLSSLALALAGIFKMNDGTFIEGQLAERTIKMKTTYGEASFKTQDVISYHDGVLKLRDGNALKGIILNRSLRVKTLIGSFVIDPTKLLSFEP